jgi:hypothetical protein
MLITELRDKQGGSIDCLLVVMRLKENPTLERAREVGICILNRIGDGSRPPKEQAYLGLLRCWPHLVQAEISITSSWFFLNDFFSYLNRGKLSFDLFDSW